MMLLLLELPINSKQQPGLHNSRQFQILYSNSTNTHPQHDWGLLCLS